MNVFNKTKFNTIEPKLHFVTPEMVTSAVSAYTGFIPDGYTIIHEIVDTYTYYYPEIHITGKSVDIKIIDPNYKEAFENISDEFMKEKMAISSILDKANELFSNNLGELMADIITTEGFKKNTRLCVDKSISAYMYKMNSLPIYEMIHFNDNRYLKNLIMINFVITLLMDIEGQSAYRLITRKKEYPDVIRPEMYEITGTSDVSMFDILSVFISSCVHKDPVIGKNEHGQITVEWLSPNYKNYLITLLDESLALLINERIMAMDKNMIYMCLKAHEELFTAKFPVGESSMGDSLKHVKEKLTHLPFTGRFYFHDDVFKNMAMSYIH